MTASASEQHLVGLAKEAAPVRRRDTIYYTYTYGSPRRRLTARRLTSQLSSAASLFDGTMYIQKRPVFPYRQSTENFGSAKTINRKDV